MNKKEFDWEEELAGLKHKQHMAELKFIRETERMKHIWQLESQRIKSAEIKKTIERRNLRASG